MRISAARLPPTKRNPCPVNGGQQVLCCTDWLVGYWSVWTDCWEYLIYGTISNMRRFHTIQLTIHSLSSPLQQAAINLQRWDGGCEVSLAPGSL